MKLAILTADEPIYLPDFFDRVLTEFGHATDTVYAVPPLYKGQTRGSAAWRYYRTFGAAATAGLTRRVVQAKLSRRSIEEVCIRHGVRHAVATDVNAPDFIAELRRRAIDLIVSVSCPQIFKKEILEMPALGCLNIHGALLPEYRGVMPSFWMLANGEREAGVTIYFMNEAIDAGEVAAQQPFEIGPTETLDDFVRRSKRIAADLLVEVLHDVEDGNSSRRSMNLSEGSYYSWPTRAVVPLCGAAAPQLW
jgi:methionyl-tRNA formyltransferase